jgi:hypothetical protein
MFDSLFESYRRDDTLLFVLVTIRQGDAVTKSALIEKVSRMIKVDASLKKPAMLGAKGGLPRKGSFHWLLSV